jgi:hypothetical protein
MVQGVQRPVLLQILGSPPLSFPNQLGDLLGEYFVLAQFGQYGLMEQVLDVLCVVVGLEDRAALLQLPLVLWLARVNAL